MLGWPVIEAWVMATGTVLMCFFSTKDLVPSQESTEERFRLSTHKA